VSTIAILTAAGAGTRLGRDLPKALVEVGGVPLVVHAARRLAASGVVDAIVVTAPAGHTSLMSDIVGGDGDVTVPVGVVPGGASRQESVAAGLAACDEVAGSAGIALADVILVHDAARPFASPGLIRRVADAVRAGHAAVVPGVPVVDTIKVVTSADVGGLVDDGRGEPGAVHGVEPVLATPDRATLRAIQTPQGFDRQLLVRAHAAGGVRAPGDHASDDAGLVEALGEPVVAVPGESAALKITTAADLVLAAAMLRGEQ
jgi:2-C-methyl-D-erythritol 4-phosphate cytidylyltransferase